MSSKVIIGLGGNVGSVKNTLFKSILLISTKIGSITLQSSIYKTDAWGIEGQPPFLNQVIEIRTDLSPSLVLEHCMIIEQELGRDRVNGKKWEQRVIDIDILFYDDLVIDLPQLKVPHPFIQDRNFVLIPLAEIVPDYVHPALRKTILELGEICSDEMEVNRLLV